jgi:hypothetical protein
LVAKLSSKYVGCTTPGAGVMRQNTPYKIEVRGPGPNKHTLAESGRRTETSELSSNKLSTTREI